MTTQVTSPFAGSGDARSTFNPGRRYTAVEGVLADMPEVVVSQDRSRTQMAFRLEDVRLVTADGVEQFKDEHTVFLPYSSKRRQNGDSWVPDVIDNEGNILPPDRSELYFEVFLPEFKEAGLDLQSGESLTAAIGAKLSFEEKVVERRYWNTREGESGNVKMDSHQKLDETGRAITFNDTNQRIFIAEDGTELLRDRETKSWTTTDGEPTDKEPERVPATYTGLILTSIA